MLTHSPKPKACQHCAKPFLPARPLQAVCSPVCARRLGEVKKAKEKQALRERKKALETIPELKKAAQVAVNKYARLRDIYAGRGCISCGARPEQAYGGTADAGHFRSVGAAPHLRYYLPQIRLQCVRCNRYLSGNVSAYRVGLVALLGVQAVEEIERMQGSSKWGADYLRRLKAVFTKKARRMEKRLENA
jgi:hypothetical protein